MKLERTAFWVASNYFTIGLIIGISQFFQIPFIDRINYILLFALLYLTCVYFTNKASFLDYFILICSIIIILSAFISDVPFDICFKDIRSLFGMMLFFYVGRGKYGIDYKVMRRSVTPILIADICGLVLYFWQPAWYINYKVNAFGNEGSYDSYVLEMSRLSSFWAYPYWVSYGSAILFIFILSICYNSKRISLKDMLILMSLVMILLLAQQRTPIVVTILATIFFLIAGLTHKQHGRNFNIRFFVILLFSIIGSYVYTMIVGDVMNDRLIEKFDFFSDPLEFLTDRAEMVSFLDHKPITMWGDGIGRYTLTSIVSNQNVITDQQYLKIAHECGWFGICFYLTIFVYVIMSAIRHPQKYFFELNIILFYIIAMFGANSLLVMSEHSAIFWFCCGKILNKKV